MKVLFIGGSGNISSACTHEALLNGHEVIHFNRGLSKNYQFGNKVKTVTGDIHIKQDRALLDACAPFDVVANFIGFLPDEVESDLDSFKDKCEQYIFISSATVYQKPADHYLVTEDCPLGNPFWEYARNKIACENVLTSQHKLKYTIIRPSYTYGITWIPVALTAHSYSPVYRIRKGLPVISHGDGESLWVTTHASDFARAFVGLFGNTAALNNHFHITSDEVLTWDAIYRTIGRIVGREPNLVHVPSDFIKKYAPDWGDGLLGDKARSVVFDNSKIKSAVPGWSAKKTFAQGISESIAWYESSPERMEPDPEIETKMETILRNFPSS
jgi:nucleoside-diphosphate-sugar epimerase